MDLRLKIHPKGVISLIQLGQPFYLWDDENGWGLCAPARIFPKNLKVCDIWALKCNMCTQQSKLLDVWGKPHIYLQ